MIDFSWSASRYAVYSLDMHHLKPPLAIVYEYLRSPRVVDIIAATPDTSALRGQDPRPQINNFLALYGG